MRVLFLTTAYPTADRPVFGTFVREHARAAATACEVAVVHLDRAPPDRGLYDVVQVDDEVPTWRVRYRRVPPPFSYLGFLAGTFAATRRIGKPDVIHAHSFVAAQAGLVLGRILRRPVAYTEHWSVFLPEDPQTLSPRLGRFARVALEQADIVLPVSDALRDALARFAPRARLRVVRNAVDDDIFRPAPALPAESRLITVGMMDDDSKGIDRLLDALVHVPGVPLDVVGDGALRGGYEQRTRELGLQERVTFHGRRTKAEIAELLRSATVFVLASRFENNPVVVLEAQCAGLPVVATAVGGVPEIVTDAVPGWDAEAFAKATRAALADPRRPVDAASKYGLAAVGDELATVYSSLRSRAG